MLQAGDAEFQASAWCFALAYGNPMCNLRTGNSPSCNPSTKATTKPSDKIDAASYRGTCATYGLATLPHATHLQRPRQSLVTRLTLPLTGKYINDTLAKLFEGLRIARLTTHTEVNESLTSNQLGTKPCTQTHDETSSLLSTKYHK